MTDQTNVFRLERLYAAVVAQDGQAPSLQLVARTPGVRPEQLSECVRMAQLLPPPANLRSDDMPGSFGLFRGETVDYILAKAQANINGIPQFQYMLAPSAALRVLGGNIHLFEGFAREPIPQYATVRTDLPPFVLDNPEPPDQEMQTDNLLQLIDYCKGDLKVVGALLAGLVQAMGLGIINAPSSMHDRLSFIQGLLTLLPQPARTGITFATSVTDPAATNSQIKFLATDVRPPHHLIYDWATHKLLTEAPEDLYSKFIMSQLRLDISMVLEQTEKLVRTAVWRAMRKDDMANALAWVARRATIDGAVLAGLPADRVMVAKVLREDPTLPDDYREAYADHLLKFALALDDPSETEIVPIIASQNRKMADAVYRQIQTATQGDQPMSAYHLVERWITQPPVGANISRWYPLLGMALVAENRRLLTGDPAPLLSFLEKLFAPSPVLQLETAIGQVIFTSRQRGYDNPDLARTLFLLAINYLPGGGLQRLLSEGPFVSQLPESLRVVATHMVFPAREAAPTALLARAAEIFGPSNQSLILARLVDWALAIQRFDLIDADTLHGLIRLTTSPLAQRFDAMIQHLVEVLTPPNILKTLSAKAQGELTELSLASGRYGDAIQQLETYQRALYKGTPHDEMAELTRGVFRDVPLDADALHTALEAIQNSELNPVTRANAYIGALEGRSWGTEMESAARKLTAIVFADPRLTALIGVEPVLRLIRANADRHDAMEAVRLASAMVEYALSLAVDQGPTLIEHIYPLLTWDADVDAAALEILRSYVRRAPPDLARDLPITMGKKYGANIGRALDISYRMRLMLGGLDFASFAERVHIGAQLLTDMALTYYEGRELPQIHALRRTLEGIPGGLSEQQRERLSRNLNTIGQQILNIVQIVIRLKDRTSNDGYRVQLLRGSIPPETSVDALYWLGGHVGESRPSPVSLKRAGAVYLFGSRSVNVLLSETDALVALLDGLLLAFPDNDPGKVDVDAWKEETITLWAEISLHKQRLIQGGLAEDAQALAQLIKLIGDKGSDKSFQPSRYARQLYTGHIQPRNVLDALRWVSGYFAQEHDKPV